MQVQTLIGCGLTACAVDDVRRLRQGGGEWREDLINASVVSSLVRTAVSALWMSRLRSISFWDTFFDQGPKVVL